MHRRLAPGHAGGDRCADRGADPAGRVLHGGLAGASARPRATGAHGRTRHRRGGARFHRGQLLGRVLRRAKGGTGRARICGIAQRLYGALPHNQTHDRGRARSPRSANGPPAGMSGSLSAGNGRYRRQHRSRSAPARSCRLPGHAPDAGEGCRPPVLGRAVPGADRTGLAAGSGRAAIRDPGFTNATVERLPDRIEGL